MYRHSYFSHTFHSTAAQLWYFSVLPRRTAIVVFIIFVSRRRSSSNSGSTRGSGSDTARWLTSEKQFFEWDIYLQAKYHDDEDGGWRWRRAASVQKQSTELQLEAQKRYRRKLRSHKAGQKEGRKTAKKYGKTEKSKKRQHQTFVLFINSSTHDSTE